jgi:alkylation response protein AidB-like acyl-CoA dehydrogenase
VFRKSGITGLEVNEYGGPGLNSIEAGAMMYELGKVDAGLALFMFVQSGLGVSVINDCGSEE